MLSRVLSDYEHLNLNGTEAEQHHVKPCERMRERKKNTPAGLSCTIGTVSQGHS